MNKGAKIALISLLAVALVVGAVVVIINVIKGKDDKHKIRSIRIYYDYTNLGYGDTECGLSDSLSREEDSKIICNYIHAGDPGDERIGKFSIDKFNELEDIINEHELNYVTLELNKKYDKVLVIMKVNGPNDNSNIYITDPELIEIVEEKLEYFYENSKVLGE